MIKQIWTVRSLPKLFNGLTLSLSTFMLLYTVLNVIFFDKEVITRLNFWSSRFVSNDKLALLIVPVLCFFASLILWHLSNVPKKLKYEVTEATRKTALKDIKNHREYIVGSNFLITIISFFVELDALNTAKSLPGFGLFPALIGVVLLIIFTVIKYFASKKIYEL